MLFKRENENNSISAIIVGLGNPGTKYDNTRHNVGFSAIDYCAKKWGCVINKVKFNSLYGSVDINGQRILLLKPQTFMNLSGNAVNEAASFYKIAPKKIVVIFDDISLEPGRIRLRRQGSAGGHNGLKSIISHIGEDFPRVKIGVGEKPHPDYDLAAWVLSKFSQSEAKAIADRQDDIADAALMIAAGEIENAMNKFSS